MGGTTRFGPATSPRSKALCAPSAHRALRLRAMRLASILSEVRACACTNAARDLSSAHDENAALELLTEKAVARVGWVWHQGVAAHELGRNDPRAPRCRVNALPESLARPLGNDEHRLDIISLDVIHDEIELVEVGEHSFAPSRQSCVNASTASTVGESNLAMKHAHLNQFAESVFISSSVTTFH